jgi:hypothetical protein
MGLYSDFVGWYSGIPTQADQKAAQDAANARYATAVKDQIKQGYMDYNEGMALIAAQDQVTPDNQDAAFTQDLGEGAKEGLDNLLKLPGEGMSAATKSILSSISWEVWVALAVIVLWYLGVFVFLRGLIKAAK